MFKRKSTRGGCSLKTEFKYCLLQEVYAVYYRPSARCYCCACGGSQSVVAWRKVHDYAYCTRTLRRAVVDLYVEQFHFA
jgi:hypothetical protein